MMKIQSCILFAISFLVYNTSVICQSSESKQTLFQQIENAEKVIIQIDTDVKKLLRHKKEKQYQPTSVLISDSNQEIFSQSVAKIRVRGNKRKEVCKLPPMKIDLSKGDLDSLGMDSLDNLKIVLPCNSRKADQEMLLKEFLVYQLYEQVDDYGFKTKLAQFIFNKEGKNAYDVTGFLIEDDNDYCMRNQARILESGVIRAAILERERFLKMCFFQYMIANTDWIISEKHNVKLVKIETLKSIVAVPYDFDYSGFVGQKYAMPHPAIPINNVKQRYFMKYALTDAEFYSMVDFYNSKKEDILQVIESAEYLSSKSRKSIRSFIMEFFKALSKPDKLKPYVVR